MSAESALLGTDRQYKFEGTEYQVKLVSRSIKATYEQALVSRAVEKLDKSKSKMGLTKKEYRAELRLISEREDRGEFAFDANMATLQTAWGQELFMKLIMPTCPKDILNRIMEEKAEDVIWLIDRVIRESMPIAAKKLEDAETSGPFVGNEVEPQPTSSPS